MDALIHTSLSLPTTGGSAKRQAVKHGMTAEVHAENRRKAQSYLGRPLPNILAMTLPMSMVLGYRPM